jgi:CRP/FNR family transcriptional regulator, cyclic AMP receptor protein
LAVEVVMATNHSTVASIAGLPTIVNERLLDMALVAEYAAGDTILREGAAVPFLGVVEAGRVALRLHVPGRGSSTITTIEPGDLIGWSAVVPPYRATSEAVALEPTRVRAWEASALRERLAIDPELAADLLPAVLACVSDRLSTSWQQLLDLFGTSPVEPW